MSDIFNYVNPSDCNIKAQWLINFAKRLEEIDLPIHSITVMRGNNICMESYYAPYTKDSLHRMFSVTKSMVSIAIGFLIDEGKLSLDSHIVDYFQDKLPKEGAHEYVKMITIKDMLSMKTCHDKTTYKQPGVTDWVGSFFTTQPSHVPGTQFSYDTSATHVLCALVSRLSGMKLLDYLKVKFLDKIDFSSDAYMLTATDGSELGGSGLCARPIDILKVLYIISREGRLNDQQLLPKNYVIDAVKKHSDTYCKSPVIEEMQGYGYQMWLVRNNGYGFYGMGGQLAFYYPDKDIFMMTTADTQDRQGGNQAIYDAFYQEVYNKIDDEMCTIAPENEMLTEYSEFVNSRRIMSLSGNFLDSVEEKINGITYLCDENSCGIKNIKVDIIKDEDVKKGTLTYTNSTGEHFIPFGFGYNEFFNFPDYGFFCGASAAYKDNNNLLIKVQIIDSSIGSMYISLSYRQEYITVLFKKKEETMLNEYNGTFGGRISQI